MPMLCLNLQLTILTFFPEISMPYFSSNYNLLSLSCFGSTLLCNDFYISSDFQYNINYLDLLSFFFSLNGQCPNIINKVYFCLIFILRLLFHYLYNIISLNVHVNVVILIIMNVLIHCTYNNKLVSSISSDLLLYL